MLARVDSAECRRRFAEADHCYLATVRPDGTPHLVPVVHHLAADDRGDLVAFAVDAKPKRTTALQRLTNIRAEPRICLLADRYSADWDQLWWVRADAVAEIVDAGQPAAAEALARLAGKYVQYRGAPPAGPVVLATVRRWTGWAATAP
jgi:PPOX class probable F420-dependent enzyme